MLFHYLTRYLTICMLYYIVIPQAKAQADELIRLEKLMKLAQTVPYYDSIQEAESRLDYITTAVRNHEYKPYIADTTMGRNIDNNALGVFQPLHGFEDNKIVSDIRFKLVSALREAGVHNTPHAQHIIQQYHPRPHLAIHGIL